MLKLDGERDRLNNRRLRGAVDTAAGRGQPLRGQLGPAVHRTTFRTRMANTSGTQRCQETCESQKTQGPGEKRIPPHTLSVPRGAPPVKLIVRKRTTGGIAGDAEPEADKPERHPSGWVDSHPKGACAAPELVVVFGCNEGIRLHSRPCARLSIVAARLCVRPVSLRHGRLRFAHDWERA